LVGKTISHYRILDKLGQGGMGVVYRAEDTRLGRCVALKLLPEDLANDRQALQRFQREARAASAMNHPNICTLYDIGEEAGQHFITMELLEGQTLETLLGARRPEIERVIELARAIAEALVAAHAQDIVHRDIKPSNVFVTVRGEAKVLDFGVAKLAPAAQTNAGTEGTTPYGTTETTLTGTGVAVGTMSYMSPEQLEGKELDFRSDIFSFGVLLYEMASGAHPFSGASPPSTIANILTAEPVPLAQRSPVAPAELDRIVRKCLRKKADQRYQSTRDLVVDLQNLKHDTSTATRPALAPMPAEEESLAHRWIRFFAPSARRWWEINHMFAGLAYPLLAYVAWYLSRFPLTHRSWWAPLFSGLIVCTAATATLRLYFVVTGAFSPQALAAEVRRWSWIVKWATAAFWVFFAVLSTLTIEARPGVSAFLLGFSLSGFIVACMVEPAIERNAFPHAFTPRPDSPPGQQLGRVMAGAQFLLAIMFASSAWRLSFLAGEVVQRWAASDPRQSGTPPAESFLLFALFLLLVLLAVVWVATSWQMWVSPVPMARTFRRWIVYFLVSDYLAVMFGFVLIMRLRPGFEFGFAFLIMALLLALPVGQVLVASRLDTLPRPSTVELLLPWTAHSEDSAERPQRLAWTIAGLQLVFIAPALAGFLTQSDYLEWALIASDAPRKSAFVILSMGASAVAGIVITITIVAAGEKALKNFVRFFPLILLMDFPGAMPLLFITFESTNLVSTLLLLPVLAAVPFVQRRLALAGLRPSP